MAADRDRAEPTARGGAGSETAVGKGSDPWKVAFAVLLVVSLVCVVTWVLLGSRLLVVRDVAVTGTP